MDNLSLTFAGVVAGRDVEGNIDQRILNVLYCDDVGGQKRNAQIIKAWNLRLITSLEPVIKSNQITISQTKIQITQRIY